MRTEFVFSRELAHELIPGMIEKKWGRIVNLVGSSEPLDFGIEYAALIYNKELVKPADVPKTYEDLTDPKWKGKIVMADPSSQSAEPTR